MRERLIAASLSAVLCVAVAASASAQVPDTVLVNGKILVVDASFSRVVPLQSAMERSSRSAPTRRFENSRVARRGQSICRDAPSFQARSIPTCMRRVQRSASARK